MIIQQLWDTADLVRLIQQLEKDSWLDAFCSLRGQRKNSVDLLADKDPKVIPGAVKLLSGFIPHFKNFANIALFAIFFEATNRLVLSFIAAKAVLLGCSLSIFCRCAIIYPCYILHYILKHRWTMSNIRRIFTLYSKVQYCIYNSAYISNVWYNRLETWSLYMYINVYVWQE